MQQWILVAACLSLTPTMTACDDGGGSSPAADTVADVTAQQDASGDVSTGPDDDTDEQGPGCDDGAPATLGGSFAGTFTDDDGTTHDLNGGAAFGFVDDTTGGSDGDEAFAVRMLSGSCAERTEVVLTIYTSSLPAEQVYENVDGALTSNVRVDMTTRLTSAYVSTIGSGGTGAEAEITSATDAEVSGTFSLVRDNGQTVSGTFTAPKADNLEFQYF